MAWVNARFDAVSGSESACVFDVGGGTCSALDLCSAGFTSMAIDEQQSLTDVLVVQEVLVRTTPFAGGLLPATIDLAGLPDGPAKVCVTAPGTVARDCVSFQKAGETDLAINGAACRPPTAVAHAAPFSECTSPAGATVVLDGSGSSDPSSTPGTRDGIALFEWFENLGLPGQRLLGTGETLSVTLPLGAHAITLRVTDALGQTAADSIVVTVQDTTPPALTIGLSPSLLWPPNHRMIDIAASVSVTDTCSAPALVLESVTSNEPDNGQGDGNTVNDIQGVATGTPTSPSNSAPSGRAAAAAASTASRIGRPTRPRTRPRSHATCSCRTTRAEPSIRSRSRSGARLRARSCPGPRCPARRPTT